MKPAILILFFLNVIHTQTIEQCKHNKNRTYEWSRYTMKNVNPNGLELVIFCYNNTTQISPLLRVWSSVKFSVESLGEVEIYQGDNITDIACQHQSKSNIWLQTSFDLWKSNSVSLNPFKRSCVGVLTKDNYDITLFNKVLDLRLLLTYLLAIILFLLAPLLSRNVVCYYGTGISIGVVASLLILAIVLGRLVPKKSIFYSIFFACFSISAYIWNFLYGNFLMLINHYHHYLIIYIVSVSVVSFAVCYYKGPISNPRVFKLIEWSLQLISIATIYLTTNLTIVSVSTVVVLIMMTHIFSLRCPRIFYAIRNRLMPPSRKLLTNEQYEQEGVFETRKALEDLRDYCNSPECNAWKTISTLQSPTKFAEWVEGDGDHLDNGHLFDTDEEDDDDDDDAYTK